MNYQCTGLPNRLLSEAEIIPLLKGGIPPHLLQLILAQAVATEELVAILEQEGEAEVLKALRLCQTNQAKIRERESAQAEEQAATNSAPDPVSEKTHPTDAQSEDKKDKKKDKKKKKATSEKNKGKGHGRMGAEDFKNARPNFFPIGGGLCSGGTCPCGQGKLYPIEPGKTFRYEARPLLETVRYATQKLRCNCCTGVFAAHLPAEVTEQQPLSRATPEAAATSLLTRYGMGFPDLRLETLQQDQGHPLPNSTQWDISLEAFLRLRPFFDFLLTLAANAVSIRSDDAHANVITLKKEINEEIERAVQAGIDPKNVRSGINNTWVVASLLDGNEIHLALTGREHQGETCYELLRQRTNEEPLILTTDAAAKASVLAPFPELNSLGYTPVRGTKSGEKNEFSSTPLSVVSVIGSFCLQHLRLRFEEVEKNHPEAVAFVLEQIGLVFAHDRQVKEMELSASERLAFHQCHSKPVMDALHVWFQEQFSQKIVEPNSDLGKSMSYALNQWRGLTEFLRTENIHLDTNACERDVYFTILYRNNSLHYQTANGATVGDAFMGLFATCRAINTNPLNYLGALIAFAPDANRSPDKWLPWNYQERSLEVKAARDAEWAEIDARRVEQGYRQCVRTLSDDDPEQAPPPHRFPKTVTLKPKRTQPPPLQQ